MIDIELLNHIDWTKDAAFKDAAKLLLAYAEGIEHANITSGSNGVADGYVKRGIVERLREFAKVFDNPEYWLMVRPEVEITRGQGKVNN